MINTNKAMKKVTTKGGKKLLNKSLSIFFNELVYLDDLDFLDFLKAFISVLISLVSCLVNPN